MNTATWLTILGGVVGIAIVWGALKNEVGNLRTEIVALKASRDKAGERMGDIERAADKLDTRLQLLRQATNVRGVPILDDRDRFNLPEGGG